MAFKPLPLRNIFSKKILSVQENLLLEGLHIWEQCILDQVTNRPLQLMFPAFLQYISLHLKFSPLFTSLALWAELV